MSSKPMPAPGPQLQLWVRERNPYQSGEAMFAYKDRLKVLYRAAKAQWERENQPKAQVSA